MLNNQPSAEIERRVTRLDGSSMLVPPRPWNSGIFVPYSELLPEHLASHPISTSWWLQGQPNVWWMSDPLTPNQAHYSAPSSIPPPLHPPSPYSLPYYASSYGSNTQTNIFPTPFSQPRDAQLNTRPVDAASPFDLRQLEHPVAIDLASDGSETQTPISTAMQYRYPRAPEANDPYLFVHSFDTAHEGTQGDPPRRPVETSFSATPFPENSLPQDLSPILTPLEVPEPNKMVRPIVPLDPDDPNWNLSLELYEWIFSVLYPKRRRNKEANAPSGPCRFCSTVSKHAGSLQQHLIVLHRQRLARKVHTGWEFNRLLALGFAVAEMESEPRKISRGDLDSTAEETHRFRDLLTLGPLSKETIDMDAFPILTERLTEFCHRESWIGVNCPNCGTWATRRVALKEHALVCTGKNSASGLRSSVPSLSSSAPSVTPALRLTNSGRAARPSRGSPRRARGHSVHSV